MGAVGATYLSLSDLLKRTDPNNKISAIIELMAQTNEIMQDAIALEGNLPTGHRTTVRTGLPSGIWRRLYQGVPVEKSTTRQVDDACGMLESYSEVDKSLADLNGNTGAFRLSEATAFLEGMGQTFATTFIYGDTGTDPEKFMGLAPRFSVSSTDTALSGYNIVKNGGSGSDNTSIWFVCWGERTTHLIYPKGSQAGLNHEDKGQVTLLDSSSNPFEGYRDHFKWDVGLSVRDWRAVSRVANIDVSDLVAAASATLVTLVNSMIDAYYKVRKRAGTKVLYCNETVMTALHKAARDAASSTLTVDNFEGKPIVKFLGIPIRQVDAILNTEATLS